MDCNRNMDGIRRNRRLNYDNMRFIWVNEWVCENCSGIRLETENIYKSIDTKLKNWGVIKEQ